jgi:hypothetical protein
MAKVAADGCLVKPLLLRFFQDESIEFSYDLRVTRSAARQPDGWFHASTHPLMSDRELYLYMTGRQVEQRDWGYVGIMSTMFGTMVHSVVQEAMDQLGVTVPLPAEPCPACKLPRASRRVRRGVAGYCWEHGGIDPVTRSRGHLDGILNLEGTRGWDLKTIRPMSLSKAPDMDAEFFIGKWPYYFAQAQEYMRITGLRKFIVFFIAMGNPWEMREYHLEFDPALAVAVETKYKRVLAAVENGQEIIA